MTSPLPSPSFQSRTGLVGTRTLLARSPTPYFSQLLRDPSLVRTFDSGCAVKFLAIVSSLRDDRFQVVTRWRVRLVWA